MVIFHKKKIITVKSIGEDLQRARRALNLSLLAVEKKLGIGQNYLDALENNEWDLIPGEVYVRNFLKKYSDFLGFEWDKVREKYEKEARRYFDFKMDNQIKFGLAKKRFIVLPRLIRNILLGIVVAVILGYLGLQLGRLVSPPELEVLYPAEGYVSKNAQVKILGKVGRESWVGLNDQEIPVGSDGFFTIDINLNKGLNIIKLEAVKRYGRSKIVYRRVIVE